MSLKLPQGFSVLRSVGWFDDKKGDSAANHSFTPSLKLQTDKEIYRPGDSVTAAIEICCPKISKGVTQAGHLSDGISSFLVDNLTFEIKGIEKLDTQWFATQKPLPRSKQRRGEQLFLDSMAPTIVSKVIVSSGATKTYLVRVELPKVLPPSYRGLSIRYIYYVRSTLCGWWLVLENGDHNRCTNNLIQLESRAPLQIWVSQKKNNLLNEGSLPLAADQLDMHWREKDADSDWVRANENLDGLEEGYDSSRDEVSSVSSYNPTKGNADLTPRNSLSLQSIASTLSNNEFQYFHGIRSGFPSYNPLPRLSVAEVVDDPGGGLLSPQKKLDNSSSAPSPSQQRNSQDSYFSKDDIGSPHASKAVESVASKFSAAEGFIRGRSYNIRIDDQILLRFSPRNSNSTYYFGDMIGGTLTFFHRGFRRCLEVSITLETSETINQRFVHPSRRSSPTITKIQSEHHEVVADLVQTSFLFSIPIDGPMSFSTPKISVQWSLRFEFFTTPKDLDLTRYEHPLLIEQREKGNWVLPISVNAPSLRSQTAQSRNEKPWSLGNFFRT
uniref:Uncharacterized protein LOC105050477 isoform X2 n=1 Tax=Elaeis guineensis var. tenera TaxID=51953 RepID=A0A8N4EZV7_ELAGV|nr:uncharacterized protein LOC105050477 isoform X2 [Elaeis guineensis]XP_029122047.1 uncharacterized protein LOC105050477 isoform X2 [Elaeis guineensis]XP_029122048.1 uncharacterized protein LOC105050477 isoform X2 [Elaeis guineensis]